MPDLTPEPYAQCITATHWSVKIPSGSCCNGEKTYTITFGPENQGEYQVNWACNCKGFKYRRDCNHIKQAQKEHCGWMEFLDGGEVAYDGNGDKVCPKCKGPIEYRNWMV